jgi:hypothetical protein
MSQEAHSKAVLWLPKNGICWVPRGAITTAKVPIRKLRLVKKFGTA